MLTAPAVPLALRWLVSSVASTTQYALCITFSPLRIYLVNKQNYARRRFPATESNARTHSLFAVIGAWVCGVRKFIRTLNKHIFMVCIPFELITFHLWTQVCQWCVYRAQTFDCLSMRSSLHSYAWVEYERRVDLLPCRTNVCEDCWLPIKKNECQHINFSQCLQPRMHSAGCVVFSISLYTYFSGRIGWRFGRCAYVINLTRRTTCEHQRSASGSACGWNDSFKIYCKFWNFLSWKTKLFRQPRWRSNHIYSTQIAFSVRSNDRIKLYTRWWIKLRPLVLSSSLSKLGYLRVPFPKWTIDDGRWYPIMSQQPMLVTWPRFTLYALIHKQTAQISRRWNS